MTDKHIDTTTTEHNYRSPRKILQSAVLHAMRGTRPVTVNVQGVVIIVTANTLIEQAEARVRTVRTDI